MKPITFTYTLSMIRCHWCFCLIFNPGINTGTNTGIPGLHNRDWGVDPGLQTLCIGVFILMILFNHTGKGKASSNGNCKWWFPRCNQYFQQY